jgi:hypothetical protein
MSAHDTTLLRTPHHSTPGKMATYFLQSILAGNRVLWPACVHKHAKQQAGTSNTSASHIILLSRSSCCWRVLSNVTAGLLLQNRSNGTAAWKGGEMNLKQPKQRKSQNQPSMKHAPLLLVPTFCKRLRCSAIRRCTCGHHSWRCQRFATMVWSTVGGTRHPVSMCRLNMLSRRCMIHKTPLGIARACYTAGGLGVHVASPSIPQLTSPADQICGPHRVALPGCCCQTWLSGLNTLCPIKASVFHHG